MKRNSGAGPKQVTDVTLSVRWVKVTPNQMTLCSKWCFFIYLIVKNCIGYITDWTWMEWLKRYFKIPKNNLLTSWITNFMAGSKSHEGKEAI